MNYKCSSNSLWLVGHLLYGLEVGTWVGQHPIPLYVHLNVHYPYSKVKIIILTGDLVVSHSGIRNFLGNIVPGYVWNKIMI